MCPEPTSPTGRWAFLLRSPVRGTPAGYLECSQLTTCQQQLELVGNAASGCPAAAPISAAYSQDRRCPCAPGVWVP